MGLYIFTTGGVVVYIIVLLAVAIFVIWEATYHTHPERFYDISNGYIECSRCSNHNCMIKNEINRVYDKIIKKSDR